MLVSLLCLLLFHQFVDGSVDSNALRLVVLTWRHGDRNPEWYLKTDPNNSAETWPQGEGEITTMGMHQHFLLGKWLKERYKGFLSDAYEQKEVFFRSTSYNRSLQSAMANLAGFYYRPPIQDRLRLDLPWAPVPIHSQPKEIDPVLWMGFPCPKEALLEAQSDLSPGPQKIMQDNEDLFIYLRNESGLPLKTPSSLIVLYNLLLCDYNHLDEHTPPTWANRSIFDRIARVNDQLSAFNYDSPEWHRIRGGLFLNEIQTRMSDKANGINEDLKYIAYSTHDLNIWAMLQALGAFNNRVPPYAATLMFELYQRDGQYEVELYYQNETNILTYTYTFPEPHRLQIAGCGDPCPLDKFQQIIQPYVPDDLFAECGLGNADDYFNKYAYKKILLQAPPSRAETTTDLMIVLICLTIVVVMLIPAVIYLAARNYFLQKKYRAIARGDFIPPLDASHRVDEKTPLCQHVA